MDKELACIDKVTEWFAVNGLNFVVDVVVVLIILIIGKFTIKWICKSLIVTIKRSGRVSDLLESFIVNVTSKVSWGVVFMIVVQRFGIESVR